MSDMAWRYLYSTGGKGSTYQCTKCGYRTTVLFSRDRLPPCPHCERLRRNCTNCEWHEQLAGINYCARYPKWTKEPYPENHYCGEWKDKNDD